jgi:hypothetical protein
MSGLVEDYVPISEEAINNTIIKKDDLLRLPELTDSMCNNGGK